MKNDINFADQKKFGYDCDSNTPLLCRLNDGQCKHR